MKNPFYKVLSSVVFLSLACDSGSSGDGDGDGGGSKRDADAVVIGVINPITGPVSQAGVRVEADLVLAQQEINDNGGILGRPLKYVHRDSQANPESAAEAAKDLIENEGVEVIYGSVISGVTKGVLEETVPAGVLVVNGTSTSTSLTQQDNKGLFVRTASTTDLETQVLAKVAHDAGHKKIGIIASESDYTIGLANGFKTAFEAMDCGSKDCVANIISYPADQDPNTADHQSDVEDALDEEPDALYLCAYAENGAGYLQAGSNVGYTGTWYVPTPLRREEVTLLLDQSTVDQLEGVEGADRIGETGFDNYNAAFMEIWGEASGSGGTVYDAIMVTAYAANHAGEWKAGSIADAIREVSGGSGTKIRPTEYAKGVAAQDAGEAIDFDGAASDLNIDEKGDVVGKKFDVWKMVNGQFTIIETVDASVELQQ